MAKYYYQTLFRFILFFILTTSICSQCFTCKDAPPEAIWCDDFEDGIPMAQKYFEYGDNNGDFIVMPFLGRDSSNGIRIVWQAGEVSAGAFKKSFGRTPSNYIRKNSVYPDSSFDEIYWRMDVKSQDGWTGGGPAKLSRALCMANENWATGMMAHLWSGGKDNFCLGMDPASGITTDGVLKTTKYNDFDNLRWLGWKAGKTDIYNTSNSGKWYCIEGHVKLNTPGLNDGLFEFWINDTLQAASYNLNWHGTWNSNPDNYMINAIYFENYWNSGSPVRQERYFDNIVISTQRIGCKCKSIENKAEDETTFSDIKVYPNPVEDVLIIEGNIINIDSYSVFNLLGKKMGCEKVHRDNKIFLDMQSLSKGVYFLTSFDGNRYKIIKK